MNTAAVPEKNISHFLPLAALPAAVCEEHYVAVHTRFARHFLREMDHVLAYHINRVRAEYDISGGWRQRPRAFRFIVMRTLPGRPLDLSPELRSVITEDHRNFLRELRSFPVHEEVAIDRLRGQTSLEKYVFELDRAEGVDPGDARRHLRQQVTALSEEAESAFGLRQLLVNHVRAERETAAVDEPGQRQLPTLLPQTTKHAFLELYFDQREWAEEWFARPAVRKLLQDPFWGLARGYHVEEQCGVDRR